MAEGIVKKQKKELSLEEYKEYVAERLKSVYSIFERTATGDFSVGIEIPEKEDEFTELLVGLKFMLEDLQELMRVKEEAATAVAVAAADKVRLEAVEKARSFIEEKAKKLEDSRSAMIYMMRDLKRATTELEKKIRDLERFQKVTMDREKRVLELKKEIKELKKQLESKKDSGGDKNGKS
ncbi:MAG: hypothetical protein L6408_04420 [Nanoarchaeota archaeon]|nr:hypothetical protein [Nanoarchaeota archaeon]